MWLIYPDINTETQNPCKVSAATEQRLQGLFFVVPQELYWKRGQKLCKNFYKIGTLSLCHAILRTSERVTSRRAPR